jgi:CubicO group peptidase (beta-lactamase class C family)
MRYWLCHALFFSLSLPLAFTGCSNMPKNTLPATGSSTNNTAEPTFAPTPKPPIVADLSGTIAPLDAKLDTELADIASDAEHPLASLSVAAIRNGTVTYHRQFGQKFIDVANPANNKPADANTLYRIASISKLITTLGVMKLVEDGKLNLDADVSQYLGYTLRNPNFPQDAITLRMMLSHTSSLRDEGGYYWETKLNVNLKDVLLPEGARYNKGEMWAKNAKPGAYFQYANFPWGVVGTIMERVSNERFDKLMRRLILDPMNLPGGFHPADMMSSDLNNIATLYRKRTEVNDKEIWNPAGPWVAQVDDYSKAAPEPRAGPGYVIGTNGTLFGPQGNCRLSAQGLASVALMLMNGGRHNGKQILRTDSVNEMLKQQWRADPAAGNGERDLGGPNQIFNAWGLGNQHFLDISNGARGDRVVAAGGFTGKGHLGDAWGLTSGLIFDPATKNALIFMIGGPGFDPSTYKGVYSGLYRYEEKILDALYQHAILGNHK